jgi:hypothetical protein
MYTESNPPQPMRRIDFAERLSGNIAAVWVDKISSFGTFPLECMACGTLPIAVKPDITPEYILIEKDGVSEYNENAGYWTDNIYDIPLFINKVITENLDDIDNTKLVSDLKEIALKYKGDKNTLEVYESFISNRITILESALKNIELSEQNNKIEENK